ncbi:cytochrome c [Azospirillum sp.]|uniref:c-type cytochrome n=1 Tax=Azospirillum sp. TaxID=34012 RepID=UPI002617159B|nr:cytochrome c [Azospirillum sp.]
MRSALQGFCLVGTTVASLLGAVDSTAAQTTAASGNEPERLYNTSCTFCHSRPFPPFPAPELRGRKLDPATIRHFTRHGPGGMIAFRPSDIPDEDLNRLSEWIAASPAPPKPVMPSMPPTQGAKP